MIKSLIFKTGWGWCGVVVGRRGIMEVILPGERKDKVKARIRSRYPESREVEKGGEKIRKALKIYFSGKRVDFDFPLDLYTYSDFQRRVWEAARTIPYGEVRSYRWIGSRLGNPRGGRAVGNALAGNPVPVIVPCHRVIRADGSLGGFSGPGGIKLKRKMLAMEGVVLDDLRGEKGPANF